MKNTEKNGIALTIAGSDPSGGAGIQADLKTFSAVGVYGGAVITCLTVQNTRGVSSYQPVEADLVREQIRAVLEDMPVSHIKTGMVGTAGIAGIIGEVLADFSGEVICDPVFASTGGKALLEKTAVDIFVDRIVKNATVVTPNLPELEELVNKKCTSREQILAAAFDLLERFEKLRAVIIKGGHIDQTPDGKITDYMVHRAEKGTENQVISLSHPVIITGNTHGTGCTFASAFTAFHLLTNDDEQAFRKTVVFMDKILAQSASSRLGHGKGPLLHHLIRGE